MPANKPIELADTKPKNTGGVQSLEIGLSILDAVINNREPMMLKDIAQTMQMAPAKIHRYMVSLVRAGYAQQGADGRYAVGARIHALSVGMPRLTLLQQVAKVASAIKDTLQCGVHISQWQDNTPIVIDSVEPDSPISIITKVGSTMPLDTSATGRLFCSYYPDELIKPILFSKWKNEDLGISTDELEKKWQDFMPKRKRIREQGYAAVTGDMLVGVSAISLPISPTSAFMVSEHDKLEYAITVIGTTEQLPATRHPDIVHQIQAIAHRYQMV